jgi:hypothetical protein
MIGYAVGLALFALIDVGLYVETSRAGFLYAAAVCWVLAIVVLIAAT